MRVGVMILATLLVGSCSADIDVAAEQRAQIAQQDVGETEAPDEIVVTSTTTPDVPDTTVVAENTTVPTTPQELLLVGADVPDWSVAGPTESETKDLSPMWDCPLLDTLRSIDEQPNRETHGTSVSTSFYNVLAEMGSTAEATAVLDAADSAALDCPTFNSGQGWIEQLDTSQSDGWRSAGLVIADGARVVYTGYWQRGHTIVILRALGPYAEEDFPGLASALMRKLAAGVALVADQSANEPATTPPPTDPGVSFDEKWQQHPLVPLMLESTDLGADWELASNSIDGPGSERGNVVCGMAGSSELDGLGVFYRREDPDSYGVVLQQVGQGEPAQAQTWIDTLKSNGPCFDPEFGMDLTPVYIEPDVAGADDIVALSGGHEGTGIQFSMLFVAARYDGVLVTITWFAGWNDSAFEEGPSVEELVRLLDLSAPN
jgi:hypothetical protein